MKRVEFILLIFVISCFPSWIAAQGHDGLYGNEWIDYSPNKQYYKIKIHEDGMYRISAAVLQQAGVVISSINLNGLQLFHEGKEIPIQVESSAGQLDYVQFYGKKNTGSYDVNLYNDPTHHFNKKYSLVDDGASYFLTWGSIPSTMHFTTIGANLSNLPAKEQYFMHQNSVVFSSTWNEGLKWQIATEQLTKGTFEYGEGFGSALTANQSITLASEHPYVGGPDAIAAVQLFAPSMSNHVLNIASGNTTYATHNFNLMNVGNYTATFPSAIIQTTGTDVTVSGTASGGADNYYIAYIDLTYARTFDFDGKSIFPFIIKANNNRTYLEIDNIDNTNFNLNNFFLYDLTNNLRIQCFYDGTNVRVLTDLGSSTVDRELLFINEGNNNSYQAISGVTPITFRDFSSPIYTPTNYVIITHPDLRTNSTGGSPIADYTVYRQSVAGGAFVTMDVDVQELYDQFSYGIDNHPLAIRHFGHYIKQVWTNPEYVYLIGKGRLYRDVRSSSSNMLLPTFGSPGSDQLLLASINSDEPQIAVGRLAANTGDQVSLYLQKIQDVEAQRAVAQTTPNNDWTKNILHLGAGKNTNEQNIIQTHLNTMKSTIQASAYAANVTAFFTSMNPILVTQNTTIDSIVDEGVSMITSFGTNNLDFDLGEAQDYNNYQKYPLIMSLACYDGTIFHQNPLISENFIFEPQAGASVFLASTQAASLVSLNNFGQEFYNGVSVAEYGEGAAKSVKYAIQKMEASGNYSTTNQMACHYMTYHGDPAFKLSSGTLTSTQLEKSTNLKITKVFPIPASSSLNIELSSIQNTKGTISLIDMLGQTVLNKNLVVNEGVNRLLLSVDGLGTGTYLLKIELPNNELTYQKVIITAE